MIGITLTYFSYTTIKEFSERKRIYNVLVVINKWLGLTGKRFLITNENFRIHDDTHKQFLVS